MTTTYVRDAFRCTYMRFTHDNKTTPIADEAARRFQDDLQEQVPGLPIEARAAHHHDAAAICVEPSRFGTAHLRSCSGSSPLGSGVVPDVAAVVTDLQRIVLEGTVRREQLFSGISQDEPLSIRSP
jgi:hypothetical protein